MVGAMRELGFKIICSRALGDEGAANSLSRFEEEE